jgi:hypothetical protein
VVIVVAVVAMTPTRVRMRPVRTGAKCMREGVESGDMGSTLRGLLRCGQQVHLQLLVISATPPIMLPSTTLRYR